MDKKHENMDYVSPASSLKRPKSVSVSKKVLLYDWWLIKVKNSEGVNKLGLGGMVWTGTQVSRVFSSAPVIKRHNAWNFETADGVMVKIEGIINQSRTYENGFSREACSIFTIGFPYNWEVYANWWFAKDDACESALTNHNQDCSGSDSEKLKVDSMSGTSTMRACLTEEAAIQAYMTTSRLKQGSNIGSSVASMVCNSLDGIKVEHNLDKFKKEEDELPECGDEPAMGFPERSFSTGKSRIQCKVETSFDQEKVIQSVGKVDICKETPTMVTARISSRLQNLKKEKKEVEKSAYSLKKKKNEASPVFLKSDLKSSISCGHVENGQQSKVKLSDKVGQEKGSLECTPKVPGNPATRCMEEQFSFNSVGSLGLKKSRSGRLLVPNQAIWLNQKVVYDQDGGVIGIEKGHPETPSGIKTAPKNKRKA